ncbi:MAG: DUF924 family protein [Kofleriaceae bacterium]
MDPRIDNVIEFWFGTEPVPTQATARRWFVRDAAFDDQIRRKFGDLHDEAAAGGLEDWTGTARGELALLIVIDQFSRNLYRDQARAFALDARALGVASDMLLSDRARELTPHQRMVALLPYQHTEDRTVQAEGVAAYASLLEDARRGGADEETIKRMTTGLDFAKQHAAIIERFGRFPHRNVALGRSSTPEEQAFLTQPGSRF